MANQENWAVTWDRQTLNLSGKDVSYPLLRVTIYRILGLRDVAILMGKIRAETRNAGTEYLALTDLSRLRANAFIESFMIAGTESMFKTLLAVPNASKLSFVLLNKDSKSKYLKRHLESTNKYPGNPSYSYNYVYINDIKDLANMAEILLGASE